VLLSRLEATGSSTGRPCSAASGMDRIALIALAGEAGFGDRILPREPGNVAVQHEENIETPPGELCQMSSPSLPAAP
jgi:hypothetical protein